MNPSNWNINVENIKVCYTLFGAIILGISEGYEKSENIGVDLFLVLILF
jgi:hypothetical protein